MTAGLLALLIVTILATVWAKNLAYRRHRHVSGWTISTALFPPLVLILWALPPKTAS